VAAGLARELADGERGAAQVPEREGALERELVRA
jgi:hypothetical protein